MRLDAPATLPGRSETIAMIARARRAVRTALIPWITSARAGAATTKSRCLHSAPRRSVPASNAVQATSRSRAPRWVPAATVAVLPSAAPRAPAVWACQVAVHATQASPVPSPRPWRLPSSKAPAMPWRAPRTVTARAWAQAAPATRATAAASKPPARIPSSAGPASRPAVFSPVPKVGSPRGTMWWAPRARRAASLWPARQVPLAKVWQTGASARRVSLARSVPPGAAPTTVGPAAQSTARPTRRAPTCPRAVPAKRATAAASRPHDLHLSTRANVPRWRVLPTRLETTWPAAASAWPATAAASPRPPRIRSTPVPAPP
mmetsp:Transcript_57680/g.93828  ORF Transcript_57680/g.93828 Transcript_57680/m.93828 type:complete len:319 (+) Transcript_57680:351-1307(+)